VGGRGRGRFVVVVLWWSFCGGSFAVLIVLLVLGLFIISGKDGVRTTMGKKGGTLHWKKRHRRDGKKTITFFFEHVKARSVDWNGRHHVFFFFFIAESSHSCDWNGWHHVFFFFLISDMLSCNVYWAPNGLVS
jgi:hypothetical protein